MKSKNLFRATALLIITSLVIVTMNNCKKDVAEQTEQPAMGNNNFKTVAVMTGRDSTFVEKMLTFDGIIQEYIDNASYTSTLKMDVDDAIWQAKAYINTKHCYTGTKYGNVESFKITLDIPLNTGLTTKMDDIYLFYDATYNLLHQWHGQCKFENKGLVAVSLSKKEETATILTVEIQATFGQPVSYYYGNPFEEEDDWRWGYDQGYCDYSSPGSDAADKIEQALNSNHLDPICPAQGYKLVYVPGEVVVLQGYEYRTLYDTLDNYLDYLIFYCTNEGSLVIRDSVEECVEDEEMNFYYQGESKIVYEKLIEENPDLGWFFVGELDSRDEGSGNNRVIRHKNSLTFASWYLIQDNSFPYEDPVY